MQSYISKVHTTVGWKPHRWLEIPLGPKTVIVGNNGTGKSRLTASLSLILSGRAPGELYGKEDPVALASLLSMLYPSGVTEVWAETSDGIRLHPQKNDQGWNLPIRYIAAELRKPSTADTFLTPFVVGPGADPSGLISSEFHENNSRPVPHTMAELLAELAVCKTQIKTLQDMLAVDRSVIEQDNALADVTPEQVALAAATVDGLQRKLATVEHLQYRQAEYARQHMEYRQACEEVSKIQLELTALVQQGQHLLAKQAEATGLVQTAQQASEEASRKSYQFYWDALAKVDTVAPEMDACPACQRMATPGWSRAQWRANYQAQHTAATQSVQSARQAVEQANQHLSNVSTQYQQAATNYQLKQQQLAMWQARAVEPKAPEDLEEAPSPEKLAEWRKALDDARKLHASLLQQQGAAVRLNGHRRNYVARDAQLSWWRGWQEALTNAQETLLMQSCAAFQQRVQAYMPVGEQFRLIRGNGTFHYGVCDEDGQERQMLYGAERARVHYALACAILEVLPPEKRPARTVIVLDEERALDAHNLTKLMKAVGHSPYQVVVTSIVHPHTVPEGWTVLDLNHVPASGEVVPLPPKKRRGRPPKNLAVGTASAGLSDMPAMGDLAALPEHPLDGGVSYQEDPTIDLSEDLLAELMPSLG